MEQRFIGGEKGIKPKTQLTIRVDSKSIPKTTSIDLEIQIEYLPFDAVTIYDTQIFRYKIALPLKSKDYVGSIGIGLIDPKLTHQVSANFMGFELERKDL